MQLAVFVVDGVADFGLSAVLEAFDLAGSLRGEVARPPADWDIHIAGLGDSVTSARGHVIPTTPLSELAAEPIDTMVVPAVNVLAAETLVDLVSGPVHAPVLDRLRGAHADGVHLAAACTATYFLAEAGVLDGSPATTSWWLGPDFRRRYPNVQLDESRIMCHGNQVTTAGAILSHMDLALSLVYRASPDLAERTSRFLTMGNRTNQWQYVIPEIMARGNPLIAEFERWVRAHIADQFLIATAARELGISERSLQRVVRADLGMSPKDFADDIRLERAVHLLRSTTKTVDAIASEVGYLSGGALRALIRRRRDLTIAQIRGSRASR
ncbi:GlxA family transcriptional regulator [Nocardia flavorosea]|uniref:Helix-turn-helix domain-containing protein n=1 Tax=Nocardia flavorosea TaxID=53429 RepID=A0A846YCQ0_9NOCA|nr:helix-turn-helix domain-containing protein [Nocardia flavorosea]NKY54958.1 helix-turn-helix domain-containing protein [Nocardia flavorosea]